MWTYRLLDPRAIDGDTLEATLDLGFHLSARLRLRLLGVDCPERGRPGWAEATTYTRGWLAQQPMGQLLAVTSKADGFGRWLADVRSPTGTLSQALLDAGHAVPYVR